MGNAQPSNRTGNKARAKVGFWHHRKRNIRALKCLFILTHGRLCVLRNSKMRKRLEFSLCKNTTCTIFLIKSFSKCMHDEAPRFVALLNSHLSKYNNNVHRITTLTTLDISNNKIKKLNPKLGTLTMLKSLNCDDNALIAGSLDPISSLTKLQTLNAGGNELGKKVPPPKPPHKPQPQPDALPANMPVSLKVLKLNSNFFSTVPSPIFMLTKLQKLDLSNNQLATVPSTISKLQALNELNLNNNVIVALPEEIGFLRKLKSLSLKENHISVIHANEKFHPTRNPQPLPATLFTDTPLIDLNLHGNPMTSTQLNEFDGYSAFLERRQATNTKNIYGGAMANLSVTGLE